MRRLFAWSLVAAVAIGGIVMGCGPERPDDPCPSNNCAEPEDTGTEDAEDTGPTCRGCRRERDDRCIDGTRDRACGNGGEICKACGEGQYCTDEGVCEDEPCNAETCDGCCYQGNCQPGIKDFACGTNGQRCGSCPEGSHCTLDGECRACDDGCWTDNYQCREGNSDEACGSGGESCSQCNSEQTCEDGECVEPPETSCSDSCVGCCDGDRCEQGSTTHACGTDGDTCRTCPEGFECSPAGECIVPDNSRWDVFAVETTIVESSVSVDTTSEPDPFLEMTVGDASGKTSVKDNTHRATWNEVVVESARARDLKSDATYTIYDDDIHGKEKIVDDCTPGFTPQDFANKDVTHMCIGGDSSRTQADVLFRLKPK